jgi:carboxyl-terminal processing protease
VVRQVDSQAVVVSAAAGATEVHLSGPTALPAACASPPTGSKANLAALIDTFSQHYAFLNERRPDWQAEAAAALAALPKDATEAQLFTAISGLLSKFDDAHVTLEAKVEGKTQRLAAGRGETLRALRNAFEAQGRISAAGQFYTDWISRTEQAVNTGALGGAGKTALNRHAFWGIVTPPGASQPVGYLSLRRLADFSKGGAVQADIDAANALLTEVAAACANCSALVLDLSQNRGGDDRVALAVAARFASTEVPAYKKRARGDATWQAFSVQPNELPRLSMPLKVLISSVTVSAAEVLAQSLSVLPQATLHGQATRGAVSDALEKSLPNGWRFTLSHEVYTTPSGDVLEIVGVKPKEALPVFGAAARVEPHTQAVRQLMGMGAR